MFGCIILSAKGVTKVEEIQQVLFSEFSESLISVAQLFVLKYLACLIFPDSTSHVDGYIQKFHDSVVEVYPNLFEPPDEVLIQQRNAQLNHLPSQLKRV